MAAFETPNLENCWKTNFSQSVRIQDNNLACKGLSPAARRTNTADCSSSHSWTVPNFLPQDFGAIIKEDSIIIIIIIIIIIPLSPLHSFYPLVIKSPQSKKLRPSCGIS